MKPWHGLSCLLVGACLTGCAYTGNGEALVVTPNGDIGFRVRVDPNPDGTPGTMRLTFDAEAFDIVARFANAVRGTEESELAETEEIDGEPD